uniref:Uncharacterized protein n=1 Tax=Rhizophora mucronata TaxID=61149 RepID=A0A2P2P9E5_RHIMU
MPRGSMQAEHLNIRMWFPV